MHDQSSNIFTQSSKSRVLTLVFTDLADSVALKSKLGDVKAAELINEHFTILRGILLSTEGLEINVSGDGVFAIFEAPSSAVQFALQLQEAHHSLAKFPSVRIGLHVGEVTVRTAGDGGGTRIEVEGLAVDMAARIQSLARPNQILLSYPVFDNARQRLNASSGREKIEWRAHGKFIFKGSEQSLDIYEVGISGISPFTPPTGGDKAHRDVADDESGVLGWRPAVGLELPGRSNWFLTRKLGEGGFGDVWMVENQKTKEQHVVKFCYALNKLNALKREVALTRVLKENLGNRPDIGRIFDYNFDTPPYYLEMEHGGRTNLIQWLEERGGSVNVSIDVKINIVAQIAEAIEAAHSVGVLHKDIKPSNVMVKDVADSVFPQIVMIDFGIGAVNNPTLLESLDLTSSGLTEVNQWNDHQSVSGTRVFMAPEIVEGRAASVKTDIYALGVLLYQLVSNRLDTSVSVGWDRDIEDNLIKDDISLCVDGNPERRFDSAGELANRLKALPERRIYEENQLKERLLHSYLESRRKKRRVYLVVIGILLLFVTAGILVLFNQLRSEQKLRAVSEAARVLADEQTRKVENESNLAKQNLYIANIALAEASLNQQRLIKAEETLYDTTSTLLKREWGWMLSQVNPDNINLNNRNIFDARFSPDGKTFITGDLKDKSSGSVSMYETSTGLVINENIVHTALIWNMAYSHMGDKIVTMSNDRTAAILDGKTLRVLARMVGHTAIIRAGKFSPDDTQFVTVARDRTVRLWDTTTGKEIHRVYFPGESFSDILYSFDGKYIITASLEGNVMLLDSKSLKVVKKYAQHPDRIVSIALRNDGTIISACHDRILRLFPMDSHTTKTQSIQSYKNIILNNRSAIMSVDISPDGNEIAVGQDNGIVTGFDCNTLQSVYQFNADTPLWKVILSSDNRHILVVTRWRTRLIDKYRFMLNKQIEEVPIADFPESVDLKIQLPAFNKIRNPNWKNDEKWLTSSGLFLAKVNMGHSVIGIENYYNKYSNDRRTQIYVDPNTIHGQLINVPSGKVLQEFKNDYVMDMCFSADSKKVAVLFARSGLALYDTQSGVQTALFYRQVDGVNTKVAWTMKGSNLVYGTSDGHAYLLNGNDLTLIHDFSAANASGVVGFATCSNEEFLAIAGINDRIKIFNMKTKELVSTLSGHSRNAIYMKFLDKASRIMTTGDDDTVKLWDIQTGRELVTMFSTPDRIHFLAATTSKDGTKVYAIRSDCTIVEGEFFPWNLKAYGDGPEPLNKKVELWKRRKRMNKRLTMDDVSKTFN